MLGLLLTPAWFLPPWPSLIWQIAVLVLGAIALWATWSHGPWQPTPRAERERILAALALQPGQRFCDLGAGDGRLVAWVHAATGADCTGLEVSPVQWAVAQAVLLLRRGARVRLADLYRADLSGYDVLYVWGAPYSVGQTRFAEHVRRSARPGTRLVSYQHPVPGLAPVWEDEGGQRPLFVYVLGA